MARSVTLALILCFTSVAAFSQAPSAAPPDANAEKQRADRLQARLNDFPNFARYREANAALEPPATNERRAVFIGDSITDSWKLDKYFPGKPYINRGISGQTTSQMLIRFRPDVIDLKPRAVVILAGTNDIAGNTGPISLEAIEGNIASMAELAAANGIRVVIASVLPVSDHNRNAAGGQIVQTIRRPPEKILALNKWIKEFCEKRGHVFLDYFSPSVDKDGFLRSEIANDGLHPNDKGYEIMAPLAEKAIVEALKKKR
jgi:lysophospholipase L1-like esterase